MSILMFFLIPIILSTKVLWSDYPQTTSFALDVQYGGNEYYADDNYPSAYYNYDENKNLELHDEDDNLDRIHKRGFGSNREQDENEYSYSDKRNEWETVE